MDVQGQFSDEKVIDCMAVIDIDQSLTPFRPIQQKWISSIQLYSQPPKDPKPSSKILSVAIGLYMVLNFCEKNRLPIYQIDFIQKPGPEWIPIKMPVALVQKFHDMSLCYKTQEIDMMEPLGDIDVINTERKSHLGHDKEVVNVPNGYKVLSSPIFQSFLIYKRMKSRLQQTFKPLISQHYPQKPNINLGLIPSFCFPEGIKLSKQLKGFITFSFILTQQTGDRVYVAYLTFKQLLNENLKTKLDVKFLDKIYYDKGICLISKYKFTDEFTECLQHLYRLSMSRNDQPFYKVIHNFINELRLPKNIDNQGFSYSYSGCNINFDYDKTLDQISSKAIYCVFKFLPLQEILTIFKAILYEKQIIFVSQSKTILGYVMEAFTSFIFPFRWENVIIPIVPMNMKEYLTAPVPFLAGITTTQLIDTSFQTETVIVLLDSGKVMNDQDMPPLPQKLHKQLHKRLQNFQIYDPDQVKEYLQNPENTYMFKMMEIENPEFSCLQVRQSFYQFFLTLMKNYRKYWKNKFFKDLKETFSMQSTQPQLINDMFKIQDFLADLGMNKVGSFGYKFTQGTIFTAFLERRYQNSNDLVGQFFDQCLEKKKSKKSSNNLLISGQKIRYIVVKHPEPQPEKIFYSYQKFPSILPQPSSTQIFQEQIQFKIQQEQKFSEAEFTQFIEQEKQINYGFFEEVDEINFKENTQRQLMENLLSLLMKNNRQLFLLKVEGSMKFYEIFREIYQMQREEVNQIFLQWPRFSKKEFKIVQLQKQKYFAMKVQKCLPKDNDSLISVWEGNSLQIIIKGSMKILVTSQQNNERRHNHSTVSTSLTASTLGKPSYHSQNISLIIVNYRIRCFLNEIFRDQPDEIFQFIYNQVKNGHSNKWNIETLKSLKRYIEKLGQQSQRYISNVPAQQNKTQQIKQISEKQYKQNFNKF